MPSTTEPVRDYVLWEFRFGPRVTRCELWSHARGWELRVVDDDGLVRSKVEKSRSVAEQNANDWYLEFAESTRTSASWALGIGLLVAVAVVFWAIVFLLKSSSASSEIQSLAALVQAVGAFFAALAFGGLLFSMNVQNRQLAIQQAEVAEHWKGVERDLFDRQIYQQLELVRAVAAAVRPRSGGRHGDDHRFDPFQDAAVDLFDELRKDLFVEDVCERVRLLGEQYTQGWVKPLGPYFRTLYRALRFISEAPSAVTPADQLRYARLVRAQLSNDQLMVLLPNCLSQDGAAFLPLALEYDFFKVVSWPHRIEPMIVETLVYAKEIADKYGDEWRTKCSETVGSARS